MLFAGKMKQREVLLQEDAGIENTHELQDVKHLRSINLLVQNCQSFYLCHISLNAESCYFFVSL